MQFLGSVLLYLEKNLALNVLLYFYMVWSPSTAFVNLLTTENTNKLKFRDKLLWFDPPVKLVSSITSTINLLLLESLLSVSLFLFLFTFGAFYFF